jgi:autotransporter-associated beta strand protein
MPAISHSAEVTKNTFGGRAKGLKAVRTSATLTVLGLGLAMPLVTDAKTINFMEAGQGYSAINNGGAVYNQLYYGQGAYTDPGNNVWNGFGNYGGPGSTAFFGSGNPNSNPPGNPGNPYAQWGVGNGSNSNGTVKFDPTNPGVNAGNAYSDGTLSPITFSAYFTGQNGGVGNSTQGQPNYITSTAALVSNGAVGTFTLSGVPSGAYDLFLYGSNYDNTRGAAFTVSSGVAYNGVSSAINSNTGGQVNNFTLGQDYVEFVGVTPSSGVISGTFSAVTNPNSGLSGEGDFNGLQLVSVASSPVYIYTGSTNGSFDTSTTNFYLSTDSTKTPVAYTTADGTDIAQFDDSATTGTHNIVVATGGIAPDEILFNNSSSNYNFSGGTISGNGYVIMNGSGTVTLNQSNTYTGQTQINAGTLIVGPIGTIGSSAISVASGATLNVSSGGKLTSSSLVLTDNGTVDFAASTSVPTLNGAGTVNLLGTGITLTFLNGGNFTGNVVTNGSTVALAGTSGGSFAGVISDGTSAGKLVVNSTGTWNISGASTFTGGTTLTAGVAKAGNNTSFGSGTITLSGGSIASSVPVVLSNLVSGGAFTLATGSNLIELTNTSDNFTGPIVINGGTLRADGTGTINNLTTIQVNNLGSYEPNFSAPYGAGETVTLTGPGMTSTYGGDITDGPTGALNGVPGQNNIFAGNIVLNGGAYVASGADGSLTLTGSISGTGPLSVTGNPDDSVGAMVILAPTGANTYTGETQLIPDINTNVGTGYGTGTVLKLGATNGISPNSGLNIKSGLTAEFITFDTGGFNQSLTYLTGTGIIGAEVANSGSTPSTLTITSGLKGGVASNFGVAITGNISVVMNDPTKAGTQILSGTNTYTGTTTITGGRLTVTNPNALSTSTVTLNGGTLGLGIVQVPAPTPILTSSNFSNFTLNAGQGAAPSYNNSTLQLTTSGVTGNATSSFNPTKVTVSDPAGFTASFHYYPTGGYADGAAFVFQTATATTASASGGGGNLGYGGGSWNTSAAVLFNIYNFNVNGGIGTAFATGGTVPSTYIDTAGVNGPLFYSNGGYYYNAGQVIDVTLTYDGIGKTLTETLYGESSATSFSTVYTGIDYSAILGGPANGSTTAYVGFTGATGGVSSTQTISNFSYSLNVGSTTGIANTIVGASNSSSSIQIQASAAAASTAGVVGPTTINSLATISITNLGTRGVFEPQSLTIAATGKLDLGNNDMDLPTSTGATLAQVNSLLTTGFAGGAWNGYGISSSAAAANTSHLTALGVIVNNNGSGVPLYGTGGTISSTFDGISPGLNDILVKYTYYGDANLDGAVDGSDYTLIDAAFLADKAAPGTLTGWAHGDFNYDGKIDGSDYTLIDNAFNTQGASLGSNPAAIIASSTAQFGGSSAVPEPTTLGLLGMGAAGLLGKRRRR